MYIVEMDTDAGTVQVSCASLELARVEEAKCLVKNTAGFDDEDNMPKRKYVEGIFGVKTFLACINPSKRKDKEGQMSDWFVECTSCGKCLKRGNDRLARFKAKYAKP